MTPVVSKREYGLCRHQLISRWKLVRSTQTASSQRDVQTIVLILSCFEFKSVWMLQKCFSFAFLFFLCAFLIFPLALTDVLWSPPACALPPRANWDLCSIAFEQALINKQLQDRKTHQAGLLHDDKAFNFWFHSPLKKWNGWGRRQSKWHSIPPHRLLFMLYYLRKGHKCSLTSWHPFEI